MRNPKSAGGGDFYDRVYDAERPELFFKAAGHRVVGTGGNVRIRRDSRWNVPEPELTLLIAATGKITGYTIGNDMSSRDIEGENPLYLPQAKIYDGSCAIGPCILLRDSPLAPSTQIHIRIARGNQEIFSGSHRNRPHPPPAGLPRRISLPRASLSPRLLPAHRHRRRAPRQLHAPHRRSDRHHHRTHRHAHEYCRVTLILANTCVIFLSWFSSPGGHQ